MRSAVIWLSCAVALAGCPGPQEQTAQLELRAVHHSAQGGAEGAPRAFTTDNGFEVTLARGYLSLGAVKLERCAQTARRNVWEVLLPIGAAHAHSQSGPTRLGAPVILSVTREDGAAKTLGTLEPPLASYCTVELTFAPADADARDLPTEIDMAGKMFWLEGTYRSAGSTTDVPFRIASALSTILPLTLPSPLTLAQADARETWTFGYAYDRWLDGVDLSSADEDAKARTVLENIKTSMHEEPAAGH